MTGRISVGRRGTYFSRIDPGTLTRDRKDSVYLCGLSENGTYDPVTDREQKGQFLPLSVRGTDILPV